jgi:non-haem Fe2+, alpha-ketoglutarate-dependent halogenase
VSEEEDVVHRLPPKCEQRNGGTPDCHLGVPNRDFRTFWMELGEHQSAVNHGVLQLGVDLVEEHRRVTIQIGEHHYQAMKLLGCVLPVEVVEFVHRLGGSICNISKLGCGGGADCPVLHCAGSKRWLDEGTQCSCAGKIRAGSGEELDEPGVYSVLSVNRHDGFFLRGRRHWVEGYSRSEDESALPPGYRDNGFAGPFTAMSPAEMAPLRERVVDEVIGKNAHQLSRDALQCRHLDNHLTYLLCTLPEILKRVSALYGPDIVLWRSHFWCKQPGDGAVAWHQDLTHWPLEPVINVTAWLALDPATKENACVRLVPGSNHTVHPTQDLTGDPLADSVRPECVDEAQAVYMELAAGEFFLFDEKLLHGSAANTSSSRRLGLAVRLTVPTVKVNHSQLLDGRHRNIVVLGEDRVGFNRNQAPPGPDGPGQA